MAAIHIIIPLRFWTLPLKSPLNWINHSGIEGAKTSCKPNKLRILRQSREKNSHVKNKCIAVALKPLHPGQKISKKPPPTPLRFILNLVGSLSRNNRAKQKRLPWTAPIQTTDFYTPLQDQLRQPEELHTTKVLSFGMQIN